MVSETGFLREFWVGTRDLGRNPVSFEVMDAIAHLRDGGRGCDRFFANFREITEDGNRFAGFNYIYNIRFDF